MQRKLSWLLLLSLLLIAGGEVGASDQAALVLVDKMIEAMGGSAAWQNARYLRFDWVIEREGQPPGVVRHLWDRLEDRYRVEWQDRDGKQLVALFYVSTRTGTIYVNGEPARDEDAQKYLDLAYGRFINDTYWLLMPWKLKDPGVNLRYVGPTQVDGQPYQLLHASFEAVGLTPGDQYWAYINPKTHVMDRWAYFLESFEGTPSLEKATSWNWRRWEDVGGGVRLAREKLRVDRPWRIHFPVLAILKEVPAGVFDHLGVALPEETGSEKPAARP
jgi:hypothetical protein